MKRPLVGILMGSDSDWQTFKQAAKMLAILQIPYEAQVLSAHRSPAQLRRYVSQAPRRGIRVFIAGAGGAAHLAGVVAAYTALPVIGVPVETKSLKGLDSLLSTVQMPTGVPVATVAIGNAANAALLAAQVLALTNGALARRLITYKRSLLVKTLKANRLLQRRRAS